MGKKHTTSDLWTAIKWIVRW